MKRDAGVKILLLLLLAAVGFGTWVLVTSLDELRMSNLRLVEELRRRPAEPLRARGENFAVESATTPAANAAFFDRNADFGGRIVHPISADTANLNYLVNNEATAAEFYGLCNDSLAERSFDDPDVFQPLLAESWEISPDHMTYRIKLRRGVKWHDFTDPVTGKVWRDREVTAADFKFFFDVLKNPQVNCASLRGYYQDMKSLEIVNDHEFIVKWGKEYYGSLSSTLGLMPLPRHFYYDYEGPFQPEKFNDDHLRNSMIVGCGAYRFVRWDKDSRVLFEAFDGYYGKKLGIAPPVRQLAYELYRHPNTRFQALLSGDLDICNMTPEQYCDRTDVPAFLDGRLKKLKYLPGSYTYIGYNQANPRFQDKRVRQALTMLVDREAILKNVYRSCAVIVTGTFRPGLKYNDPDIRPWPFDVERAGKLLREAGWRDTDGDGILDRDGKKFEFTILQVASHPIQEKMLPMIQQTMAQAGVSMKTQTVEWSVYVRRLEERDFEVCTLGWTSSLDPDPYQLWHSSQIGGGGSNFVGFANPEADRVIEELRRCFDPERRLELARRFSRILHEEQPYTFLFAPEALVAISGRYRNVRTVYGGLVEKILWTPRAEQRSVANF